MARRASERYLAYHLLRTLGYISSRVIRADFRPAPIARSLAIRDLACSHATWKRDVRALVALRLIAREVRPGRPRGGGKNHGSLYQVDWALIAVVRGFKPGHVPRERESKNGSLRVDIGSLMGYAHSEMGSSLSEMGLRAAYLKTAQFSREPSKEKEGERPPRRPVLATDRPAAGDLPVSYPPAPFPGEGGAPAPALSLSPATSSPAFQQAKARVHHTLRRSKR